MEAEKTGVLNQSARPLSESQTLPHLFQFKHGCWCAGRRVPFAIQAVGLRGPSTNLTPDTELIKYACDENEKDVRHQVGK